jgi:hypothetical protein
MFKIHLDYNFPEEMRYVKTYYCPINNIQFVNINCDCKDEEDVIFCTYEELKRSSLDTNNELNYLKRIVSTNSF